MTQSPLALAQAAFQAYIKKDRSAIEALLADDFRFTSPIDNGLNRATYLEVCWPNSEVMKDMKLIYGAENGDRAFIVYEVQTATKRFRNSEVHTVRDGKLVATEVYFGWDLPHNAKPGEHIDNDGDGHA